MLADEPKISLSSAAWLPELQIDGQSPSPTALWRWAHNGIKGDSGRRVYLESIKLGGRIATSREAVVRFCRALQDTAIPSQEEQKPARPCNQQARARSIAEAEQRVIARGM